MAAANIVGTAESGARSAGFTLTPPAGAASYIAILEMARDDSGTPSDDLTAPSGWTLHSSGDSAGSWWSQWRIYTGTSAAGAGWSFSHGHVAAIVIGLDAAVDSMAVTTTVGAAASGVTSVTCPTATLTDAALVIRAALGEADSTGGEAGNPLTGAVTYPSSATLAHTDSLHGTTATARAARNTVAAQAMSAGSTGTAAFSLTGASWCRPVTHTIAVYSTASSESHSGTAALSGAGTLATSGAAITTAGWRDVVIRATDRRPHITATDRRPHITATDRRPHITATERTP